MGTMVVRGHGVAVVTTTGMDTQLGRIAGLASVGRIRTNTSANSTGATQSHVGRRGRRHCRTGFCGRPRGRSTSQTDVDDSHQPRGSGSARRLAGGCHGRVGDQCPANVQAKHVDPSVAGSGNAWFGVRHL